VYGVIKVVTTIFYVTFLVEYVRLDAFVAFPRSSLTSNSRIGRRLPLLIGASIQATSMLYLALYIRFGSPAAFSGDVGGTPAGGIVGVVFIYLYAFGWSFGHSVACYVVAAEIFPTRIVSARVMDRSVLVVTR